MTVLIAVLLILALGGSALFLWYAEIQVMRDGQEQLGQQIPGARRRAIIGGLVLICVVVSEVALWFVGDAAGGPMLGGALVIGGIIVFAVLGFALAVADDTRRRERGQA